ncbi:hypothetical protein [Saccharothrix sp. BKS2]|uniref:hypothetical protein n=1 Tax=Saccharothrix sp. BKS2 TaxID=3064400 RepID=UPI0039EC1544
MTENDNTGNTGTPDQGRPGQGGPNVPTAPGGAPPPYVPAPTSQQGGRSGGRGQVRNQEPGKTKPRPPTVAEQRARSRLAQQEREAELAREAEEKRKKKLRKRLLISGGVVVGVVGVVAIWYAAASPDEVDAQCTMNDVVVDDDYCDDNYVNSHGGYHSGGFFYIGGNSYRYHYGGPSTPVGQKVSGGSYTLPKGASVSTSSGKVIQRGGFGVSGGSKSGSS